MGLTDSFMIQYGFKKSDLGDRRCYTRQYDDRMWVAIYEANGLFHFQHEGGISYIDSEVQLAKLYEVLTGK
jgi:hypothetical protein